MKFLIALLVVVSCAVFFAPSAHAGDTPVCQQITNNASHANATVRFVVENVFVNLTHASSPLKKYFDGTWGAKQPVNYLSQANAGLYNTLFQHLVTFFYSALGCYDSANYVNGNDGSVYTDTNDLVGVHAGMGIGKKDFDYFNNVILGVMKGAGLNQAQLAAVSGVLNGTGLACTTNQKECGIITNQRTSICDKYSDAQATYTTNTGLVTTIVTSAVGKLTAQASTLKKFFDGSIPQQTVDYTAGGAPFNALAGKLVAFFGTALGCTDGDFAPYTPFPVVASQQNEYYTVHQHLEITAAEFDQFNDDVIATLQAAGVSPADRTSARTVLDSLENFTVLQTTPTAPTVPSSGSLLSVNFIVALFALLVLAMYF